MGEIVRFVEENGEVVRMITGDLRGSTSRLSTDQRYLTNEANKWLQDSS